MSTFHAGYSHVRHLDGATEGGDNAFVMLTLVSEYNGIAL
jgi:hypothetical protein